MHWTRDKKRALTIAMIFLALTSPLWIWIASNAGAAVLSLALEREPTRAELTGDYKYVAMWGTAVLHLDPNGNFTELVKESPGPPTQYTGLWNTTGDDNSAKVTFRPFGVVWDENHNTETNIFAINFYKRRFGKTYAKIDDDLGEQFEQQ